MAVVPEAELPTTVALPGSMRVNPKVPARTAAARAGLALTTISDSLLRLPAYRTSSLTRMSPALTSTTPRKRQRQVGAPPAGGLAFPRFLMIGPDESFVPANGRHD